MPEGDEVVPPVVPVGEEVVWPPAGEVVGELVVVLPPPPMHPLATTEKATKKTTNRPTAVFAFIIPTPVQ